MRARPTQRWTSGASKSYAEPGWVVELRTPSKYSVRASAFQISRPSSQILENYIGNKNSTTLFYASKARAPLAQIPTDSTSERNHTQWRQEEYPRARQECLERRPSLSSWTHISLNDEGTDVCTQIQSLLHGATHPWRAVDLLSPSAEVVVKDVLQQELDDVSCPDEYRAVCMKMPLNIKQSLEHCSVFLFLSRRD
ncbi:hypothetical protein EDD85DRAFT_465669 [Armillaria nabsnona]|nr:hypothetical protein EDD85DRAFT_465669 [Armillaria nabsnona]